MLTDGTVVRNLRVRFEGGRAVQIDADTAAETLRTICARDEGAARLGEIALVDREGRIGQLETVFYDTLLDENAASHIAFGQGFPFLLSADGDGEQVNASEIHIDFMIGSNDLAVTGITAGGERVPVLRDGVLADLDARRGVRWPVQLLLVALIWGASFMFIKVELDAGLAPVHVAFLRCAFGAPTLLLILAVTKDRLPRDRALWATCSCSAR